MGQQTRVRRAAAVIGATLAVAAVPAAAAQAADKYLVVYKGASVPAGTAAAVEKAGGTLVATYDAIGVAVASSSSTGFRSAMLQQKGVDGVAATSGFATQVPEPSPGDEPATDVDTFSPLQWDMRQIHAPEAHAVTGGAPTVLVGDIDTGLDKDHPDLQANIDFQRSVSCESGAPDHDPNAWDDRNGHGTHTAGTIAAADNGFGIVGVAPNVRIVGIKSANDGGFFFPEMVVCSFMYAAQQGLDVTNNSYYADPWLFNCRNDAEQRAIWKAESRAIRYAIQRGVTVVAAEGNESTDLSHPSRDETSPDYPPGSEQGRDITNACVVVPVEVPGVIGVTALGSTQQADGDEDDDYLKSFYSSYGVSTADIAAPGGDSLYRSPESVNGRVLSTYPAEIACSRRMTDPVNGSTYCYLQGTSMASPHVAGVAALVISRYGKMPPGQVEARLQQTADPQPCPTSLPAGYLATTQSDGSPQACDGGPGHTSWYGAGRVDALAAVTK